MNCEKFNLEEFERLAASSSKSEWRAVEHRNCYFPNKEKQNIDHLLAYRDDPNFYFLGAEILGLPDVSRSTFTSIDAEFIMYCGTHADEIVERIKKLEKIRTADVADLKMRMEDALKKNKELEEALKYYANMTFPGVTTDINNVARKALDNG